jgi:hypothetical protein
VGNILKRNGISPAPERKKTVTWREFIRSHWEVLVATGFFGSEVWSWLRLAMSYLLSFIHCSRLQVQSVGGDAASANTGYASPGAALCRIGPCYVKTSASRYPTIPSETIKQERSRADRV